MTDRALQLAEALVFLRAHVDWLAESWSMTPEGRAYKAKFEDALAALSQGAPEGRAVASQADKARLDWLECTPCTKVDPGRMRDWLFARPAHSGFLRESIDAAMQGDSTDKAESAIAISSEAKQLREALEALVEVIDAAGLDNLARGVQLGPTVWYVKASDAMKAARIAIDSALSGAEGAQK